MAPLRRSRIYKWELEESRPGHRGRSLWRKLTPPQIFLSSFLLLIVLGTIGFKILPGLYTGEPLGWLDALFTTTSAVCVTGLIVVDTATYFTPLGRAYLLLLIQLGGLGIITYTTVLILLLGRRLSLRHELMTSESTEVAPQIDFRRLTRDVILFTVGIETVGALLLWFVWLDRFEPIPALGHAVFHSISGFCNAGFSTFSDSMISFQGSSMTLMVLMALIITGGIGFLTLEELLTWLTSLRERAIYRVSLHSRLVLTMTGLLILFGWILLAVLEWEESLQPLGFFDKLANALFLSVTPRTAGYNNIDYARATDATNFVTILLMTIGGSPGSTAGGLKTTTIALPGLEAWSRFRGYEHTSLWGRTIPPATIQRAVGLIVAAGAVVALATLIVTFNQHSKSQFLHYFFEIISAFNTVGLSMGVTPHLTDLSKWTTILMMFVGRVGLPTAAAALTLPSREPIGEFRYAHEDVILG